SLDDFGRCLFLLKRTVACPVWVLAGNHDLWVQRGTYGSSKRLWEEELPRKTAEAGCTWLEGQSLVQDGIAVAGSTAGHDSSPAAPKTRATRQQFAENKRYYTMAAIRINWDWTARQFAERVAVPLLETLDRLEANPAVRQTVVVTHVPVL